MMSFLLGILCNRSADVISILVMMFSLLKIHKIEWLISVVCIMLNGNLSAMTFSEVF